MPLEPIQLDDLNWTDLTKTARDQIASTSRGEWTLHAPVDPGITFLELFAAQLEQRLYWMDQPSQARTAALLKLADIGRHPVGIAATVLMFRSPDGKAATVSSGTVVKLRDDQRDDSDQIAFSTVRELKVLPVCEQQPARTRVLGRTETLPPVVTLIVEGKDQTINLQAGRTPCLLAATGSASETEIVFWLTNDEAVQGEVSILFDIDCPSRIQPQWIADFSVDEDSNAEVAPAASLSWGYWSGGEFHELQKTQVSDGTNGLRRSGIVRLTIPSAGWHMDSGGHANLSSGVGLQHPFRLRLRASKATFTYLPRVKQIVPNVVIARHKRSQLIDSAKLGADEKTATLNQVISWRPLPGNTLSLPKDRFGDFPVAQSEWTEREEFPDMEDEEHYGWHRLPVPLKLRLLERGTHPEQSVWHMWTVVDDLSQSGPGDRHFVVDRLLGLLQFGDGLTGRIPLPFRSSSESSSVKFKLEYDVGGGARGNLPTSRPWISVAPDDFDSILADHANVDEWTAVNVVPAVDGAQPESIEAASNRARQSIRRRDRAITRDDIEQLATSTPGVAIRRAHAAIGFLPQNPCTPVPGAVTVFVVPDLPASLHRFFDRSCDDDLVALRADPAALGAVAEYLDRFRMLTHEIHVRSPQFVEVALHVEIEGSPFSQDDVRTAILESLQNYLHPLFGGPTGGGWPFGEPIRPSELVRRTQHVIDEDLHVQAVKVALLEGTEDSPRPTSQAGCRKEASCKSEPSDFVVSGNLKFEGCSDIAIPPHALVALRKVTVAFAESRMNRSGGVF